MSAQTRAHEPYVTGHAAFAARLGSEPAWLEDLRARGLAALEDSGFPSRRREEWRYTNVELVMREPFALTDASAPPVDRAAAQSAVLGDASAPQLVFVDGGYAPELSAPPADSDGVLAESLADVLRDDPARLNGLLGGEVDIKLHPFAALNTAYVSDGAVVTVPRGAAAERPVVLRFLARGGETRSIAHPRVLLIAEPGSRASIVLDFASLDTGTHLPNAVTAVRVGTNAELHVVTLQRESDDAVHFSLLRTRQERDSRLRSHVVTCGGALVRNDLEALLADEGADCTLNGLFYGAGARKIDNHTLVDHAVPHGSSRQLYKGVLGDRSRGVFRGRVVVRPDAQKTDATQSNPNLLTSMGAEVDTKPQLEIHADDVKCSHGSTSGQLDPDARFFLRARGMAEPEAREFLTRGFASEIVEALPVEALREPVADLLFARPSAVVGDRR